MISEDQVRDAVKELTKAPTLRFPTEKIARYLSDAENLFGIRLSIYGYLMHLFEHVGARMVWGTVAGNSTHMDEFVQESIDIRDNMPVLLVNASGYLQKTLSNVPDKEIAIECASRMTEPYVMYLLFKSGGQDDLAARFYEDASNLARRYPAAFDKLPASLRAIGEELVSKWHKES